MATDPSDAIDARIRKVRRQRVMLDADLAELYCVELKALNQAVRRNRARFPRDFMFQLDEAETDNLRSQIVTSSSPADQHANTQSLNTNSGVFSSAHIKSSTACLRATPSKRRSAF
jgi:cell division septum initiation protein DivIVA